MKLEFKKPNGNHLDALKEMLDNSFDVTLLNYDSTLLELEFKKAVDIYYYGYMVRKFQIDNIK